MLTTGLRSPDLGKAANCPISGEMFHQGDRMLATGLRSPDLGKAANCPISGEMGHQGDRHNMTSPLRVPGQRLVRCASRGHIV
jgi:hypothetical protein